jgi:hypothetical protein
MPGPINTPPIYQNLFMAPNGFSGIHLNSYMTDTGAVKGPASTPKPTVQQKVITPPGIAATIAFNAKGQVVTIHIGSSDTPGGAPTIMLIDPTTLNTLFSVVLPPRPPKPPNSKISFAGGYFYLDQNYNVVCVITSQNPVLQQIRIYSTKNDKLALLQTIDLSSAINDPQDILNSVLPDSAGNIWYITQKGRVGYVTNGIPSLTLRLKEGISKSFASDGEGNVYVVTDSPTPPTTAPTPPSAAAPGALYCLRRQTQPEQPKVVWRTPYDCGTTAIKPGQNQVGSGTTPTCFNTINTIGGLLRLVTIADNAPQMNVNVYSRDDGRRTNQQPVFIKQGAQNACENSLIALNYSIIIENNYGNLDVNSTDGTKMTTPGINQLYFDPDTGTSSVHWANDSIAVPSVVSQLSTGDGLIYTYAKDKIGWFWAALDFETGVVHKRSDPINAVGEANNNWYAGLTIGPNGAAYLSVFGGLTVWRPGS